MNSNGNVIAISKRRGKATIHVDSDPRLSEGTARLDLVDKYGEPTGIVLDHGDLALLRAQINAVLGAGRLVSARAAAIREFHDAADEAEAAGVKSGAHLMPGFRERLAAIRATEAVGHEVALNGLVNARRKGHGRRHDR
jgi:hypothetical protein